LRACYFSLTHKGQIRDRNEDAFLNHPGFSLFMVADGMGGHQCGEVASKVALTSILSFLEQSCPGSNEFSENLFRKAVQLANRNVYNLTKVDPNVHSIGTTLVCFIPGADEGNAFHVGDSRVYRFRPGELIQITQDHSAESKLPSFMQGLGGGKYSSKLSRAVGMGEFVKLEATRFEFKENDILLLCTDGLYSMVSDKKIQKILEGEHSLGEKCQELIDQANDEGGEDNITVTLIQISDLENSTSFLAVKDGEVDFPG